MICLLLISLVFSSAAAAQGTPEKATWVLTWQARTPAGDTTRDFRFELAVRGDSVNGSWTTALGATRPVSGRRWSDSLTFAGEWISPQVQGGGAPIESRNRWVAKVTGETLAGVMTAEYRSSGGAVVPPPRETSFIGRRVP
jgi:hypothetical protein